jgi:hypothetical protein
MATSTRTSPTKNQAAGKTAVEKWHGYLALISTLIGIAGALFGLLAWAAMNFLLGDVEIKPDKPVESIMVKVVDKRGQAATYYGRRIQLMPGNYHLAIGLPDKPPTKHADVTVQLWHAVAIPYTVPEAGTASDTAEGNVRKHWWQFWKKHQ